MNYLGKLFSSAQNYYRNLNGANLTGAVDVIVIQKEDGTLQCTPFYVRFGKMGVLYPKSNMVDIYVNEKPVTDVCMRVGLSGFAYFDDNSQISNKLSDDLITLPARCNSNTIELDLEENTEISAWKSNKNRSEECLIGNKINREPLDDVFQLDLNENESFELNYTAVTNQSAFRDEFSLALLDKSYENSSLIQDLDNEDHSIQFQDFINYLGTIAKWPDQFYIYRLNEPNDCPLTNQNHCGQEWKKLSPNSSQIASKCELLFPNDFFKLEPDESVFNSLWIVWSGHCMSARTAAYCLLKQLTVKEKSRIIENDKLKPEYNTILTKYRSDHEVVASCDQVDHEQQSKHSKRRWFWWLSDKQSATTTTTTIDDSSKPLDSALCMNHQDQTQSDQLDSTIKQHEHEEVQSILAPITLDVASPIGVQDDFERYNVSDNSIIHQAQSAGLTVPTSPIQHYSSTNDLRFGNPTASESHSESSPEEIGYYSDEPDMDQTYLKRSAQIENKIVSQENRTLTSDQLKRLDLRPGANEAVFFVVSKYQGTCQCACFIYLWKWSDKIVISDIDGTITKSDWLGQIMPLVGMDWTHPHIAQLYHQIAINGYKFVYLSTRAIGQARITRRLLHRIEQGGYRLPDGPILLSPFSLLEAFHKEVILHKADEFKIGCLRTVYELFKSNSGLKTSVGKTGEEDHPFVAGFGNRITDIRTYKAVGLQTHQIFTIDYLGNVVCGDSVKMFDNTKPKVKPKPQHGTPMLTAESKCNQVDSALGDHEMTNQQSRRPILNDGSETNTTESDTDENILTRVSIDSMISMTDAYFPRLNQRMIYASTCSDYTYWRII